MLESGRRQKETHRRLAASAVPILALLVVDDHEVELLHGQYDYTNRK
jgi:hypothetical protein